MNLPPVLRQRFFDANANPLAGGKLYTYVAGTSTPQATYTDQGGGTPNSNPIILDANGEAAMWLDPTLTYKFVLKDSNDVQQWSIDNVIGILTPNAVNTASIQDGAVTKAKLSASLSANQLLGANAAGTAVEGKTLTAGPYITITQTVGGITIQAAGSSDTLVQKLDQYDAGIKAGEAISTNNAICLDLNYQTYKYFLCNSSVANRRTNFVGFAKASATVTAGIYTWTDSAALVTSNVIAWSINGRNYSQAFTTDNNTTLIAIATQIAADADVASAVVTAAGANDRVITITSKGGLSLTIPTPTVTGGASQATVAIANTQTPNGDTISCHAYGPLSGFVGLTQGSKYYLDSNAGGITANPSDSSPILVGQALSSTILFVFLNQTLQFGAPSIFVRAFGSSSGETSSTAQLDVEHYNYSSWSAGVSDTTAYFSSNAGESALGSSLVVVDGKNTGTTVSNFARKYNKTSWSAGTPRASAKICGGVAVLGTNLVVLGGSTTTSATGSVATLDVYNGSSWTASAGSMAATKSYGTTFLQNSLVHFSAGVNSGGTNVNTHYTWNGSSTGTATAFPDTDYLHAGSVAASGKGISGTRNGGTSSYTWDGASWSSAITVTYTPLNLAGVNATVGSASGYNSGSARSYLNGGTSGSTTSVNTTSYFNGSTWTADTASSNARSGSTGGVF